MCEGTLCVRLKVHFITDSVFSLIAQEYHGTVRLGYEHLVSSSPMQLFT